MSASNYTQTSFLGGEWSPWAQGRIDQPGYRQAMNLCLNGLPVEEGAWTRRPGLVNVGYTHRGAASVLRSFVAGGQWANGAGVLPGMNYLIEISVTYKIIRLWTPWSTAAYPTPLTDVSPPLIVSFSAATPTLMTVDSAQTWSTGDTIIIAVNSGSATNAATLAARQFIITKVSTTTFTLQDAATAADIVGTSITYTTLTAEARRITTLSYSVAQLTPFARATQSSTSVVITDENSGPQLLTISKAATNPVVALADLDLKEADGPYLDALPGTSQTLNKTATATTADGITYDVTIGSDGPSFSFTSADVGKCFRIWTQPAAYSNATTYVVGDTVSYNGNFWKIGSLPTGIVNSTGVAPGTYFTFNGASVFPWTLTPNLGKWTACYIASYIGASEITVHTCFLEPVSPLVQLNIDTWQIGAYNNGTTGTVFPASAGWFEGRLFLGGLSNRFDASMSGAFDKFVARTSYLFSPTDIHGVVLDSSGISEIYNAKDSDSALWFEPDKQGLLFGTANGEWLIAASTLGDPITPTSIQVHNVSRFKSSQIEPIRVGTVLLFLQAAGRKVYEYLVDAFSNRYSGRPLNASAQHLTEHSMGVQETAYQEDPVPIFWATTGTISNTTRTPLGTFLGCTYRRVSDFATVPPEFNGWHQHTHGNSRTFYSVATASIGAGTDTPAFVTCDGTYYRVEVMSRIWGP